MSHNNLGATNQRPSCLVVEPDPPKRAFLAEAWAYFSPGFDVVTAADHASASEWISTFRPRMVSVGASLDLSSIVALVDAVDAVHAGTMWCLVMERPPGSDALELERPAMRIVDLWDVFSLEQVLRVGRVAADAIRSVPEDVRVSRPVPVDVKVINGETAPMRRLPHTTAQPARS